MKSLYSGVAGMKVHNQRMDVIGNNISNVNTTGYKTSTVTFKDIYYQSKGNASSGDSTSGGKNPTQIGYGAQLGTVTQVMTQSGFTFSDNEFDCAIQGEGYFQVMDDAGNIYYSRAGKFSVDSYGNLVDPNGYMVLGVSGDPSKIETGQSQRINIKVPAIEDNKASATKTVNGFDITVTANQIGEQGNISFSIVNSDTPYATKSGDSLTIYMDLDQDFGKTALDSVKDLVVDEANGITADVVTQRQREAVEAALEEFKAALNDAIRQGGTDLTFGDEAKDIMESVIPLDVDFAELPAYSEVQALPATNTLKLGYKAKVDPANADDQSTEMRYLNLQFTANEPGEAGNKFEIDVRTSSANGNNVVAKWKDNVMTIQLPADLEAFADGGAAGKTLEEAIQEAIDDACREYPKKQITVDVTASTKSLTDAAGALTTDAVETETGVEAFLSTYELTEALPSTSVERLGLAGGRNNFFQDIAVAMSTVSMTGGRVASEQAVDDLELIRISEDGTIYGRHSVHGLLYLGRIDLATFENPMGLEQAGTTLWMESLASGPAQVKIAGKEGAGSVRSGALEMSNVDLAQEFSDMIITQRGYQANSRIITVSDTMLEELINLKR